MMSEKEIHAEIEALEKLLDVLPKESKTYPIITSRIDTYKTVLNGISEDMKARKKPLLPIIEVP